MYINNGSVTKWQLKLVLKVIIDQYNHRLAAPLGSVLVATAVFWLLEPSEVMTPVAKHRKVSAKAGAKSFTVQELSLLNNNLFVFPANYEGIFQLLFGLSVCSRRIHTYPKIRSYRYRTCVPHITGSVWIHIAFNRILTYSALPPLAIEISGIRCNVKGPEFCL